MILVLFIVVNKIVNDYSIRVLSFKLNYFRYKNIFKSNFHHKISERTDLRTHLYRITGVDFTQINSFGALTVLIILSEVGLDPSRFPTVKHFVSWLGLCPGSRITGGKVTQFWILDFGF
jgi:hypothetical protein